MPRKPVLLFFLGTLILFSCGPRQGQILRNEQIPAEIHKDISKLNDKLFRAVSKGDTSAVFALMHDSLLRDAPRQTAGALVRNASGSFESKTYKTLAAYYLKGQPKVQVRIPDSTGGHRYEIDYNPHAAETFIAMLIPEEDNQQMLLTAMYGYYNNEWKLNGLYFGTLSLYGSMAPDFYRQARSAYDMGYLADAVNYADLAMLSLNPAGEHLHYKEEREIKRFTEEVHDVANASYQFPRELHNINTRPQIFRISPEATGEGFLTLVSYITRIPLNDTTALKTELAQIYREAPLIYKGLHNQKKYVLYQAYNELPAGNKPVYHFRFAVKGSPE